MNSLLSRHEKQLMNNELCLSTELLDTKNPNFYEFSPYVSPATNIATVPITSFISQYQSSGNPTNLHSLTQTIDAYVSNGHQKIILNINSPGGTATAIFEFCEFIQRLNKDKNIQFLAYVGSQCASAAFLIASQCQYFHCHHSAYVGSVGAVISRIIVDDDDEIRTYVSKISPHKRPTDKALDTILQSRVDEIAEKFIDSLVVARPELTREFILENFGKGAMLNAEDALNAKMIHKISDSFDSSNINFFNTGKGTIMTLDEMTAKLTEQSTELAELKAKNVELSAELTSTAEATLLAITEAKKDEAKRQTDIKALALEGHDALVTECLSDTTVTVQDAAMRIILAQKTVLLAAKANLESDNVGHVAVAQSNDDDSLLAEFSGDQSLVDAYTSAKKDFELIGIDK